VERNLAHIGAATGDDVDEPAPLQDAQRFADRPATDAEAGREFRLDQALADRPLPADDRAADFLGDLLRNAARRGRLRGCGDRMSGRFLEVHRAGTLSIVDNPMLHWL